MRERPMPGQQGSAEVEAGSRGVGEGSGEASAKRRRVSRAWRTHAAERIGNRQQAPSHTRIRLHLGEPAQHRRRAPFADLQLLHDCPPSRESSSQATTTRSPWESLDRNTSQALRSTVLVLGDTRARIDYRAARQICSLCRCPVYTTSSFGRAPRPDLAPIGLYDGACD
jgi:hypothetical protein